VPDAGVAKLEDLTVANDASPAVQETLEKAECALAENAEKAAATAAESSVELPCNSTTAAAATDGTCSTETSTDHQADFSRVVDKLVEDDTDKVLHQWAAVNLINN